MPHLIWSPTSRLDLADIDAYLSKRDPAAAVRILRAIRSAASRLSDYPRLGWSISEPFRVISVRQTSYLILYRLRDDRVEIVRIHHGRENWFHAIEAEL
ncbi:type II toxin-antitoxin system RelE/ParE family toxin [Sphingomonas sp. PAMC 26617]|uniref:type II toxin-antitoxin system RelE/ParE family toxin n=1 Tax=Sphingomonas sp. PAMC 26617 TaxID=1112216 RepID=UPI000288451D|nr:type II toxin-antitoxin system RelE/ParE family toxin [Sphingomonas sp. PAMC 26617]